MLDPQDKPQNSQPTNQQPAAQQSMPPSPEHQQVTSPAPHDVVAQGHGLNHNEPPHRPSRAKLYLSMLLIIIVVVVAIFVWFKYFAAKHRSIEQEASSGVVSPPSLGDQYNADPNLNKQANIGDSAKEYKGGFNISEGFGDIVQYAMPAVVNVSATHMVKAPQMDLPPNMVNPFLKEFFKQFAPPQKDEKAISLGSGFIVRSDGFVVTNNHVIKDAKDIQVIMSDGKTYEAKLYATDPLTDIAVLKVEATDLPSLKFDDSDKSRVGDWVIAIGNPFGLGGTVSSGIVSARGRDIHMGLYDEFIQTDAAINRGNSGGPMIDTKGRVIGINTAIFSTMEGGSMGIGFAIPSNVAQNVVAQLITNKAVVRGWLGVTIQDVDEAAVSILKLPNQQGALIANVSPGSPAEKFGIKAGDVIVAVNNVPITESRILPKLIAQLKPNDKVNLKIYSGGVAKTVAVTIDKFPADLEKDVTSGSDNSNSQIESYTMKEVDYGDLGFKAVNINADVVKALGLPDGTKGVVISAVADNSPASDKDLAAGLVVLSVNNQKINTTDDLTRALSDKTSKNFLFLILEPKRNIQLFITLTRGKPQDSNE